MCTQHAQLWVLTEIIQHFERQSHFCGGKSGDEICMPAMWRFWGKATPSGSTSNLYLQCAAILSLFFEEKKERKKESETSRAAIISTLHFVVFDNF